MCGGVSVAEVGWVWGVGVSVGGSGVGCGCECGGVFVSVSEALILWFLN